MTKDKYKKSEIKKENVNGGVNFKKSTNSLSNTENIIQNAKGVLNNTTDSDKQKESNTKVLDQNNENNDNPNSVSNNQVDDKKKKYIAPFLPITVSELKSLIPNTVIFFLLTFIYSVWRNCKDSFFYELGATIDGYDPVAAIQISKIVSFLSTFAVLYLYTKFKPYLTRKKLFNTSLFIYLTLLTIFLFVLHNRKDYYLLDLFSEVASNKSRFINVFAAIVVWPIVIFYVFTELWGTFVLGIIFWMLMHVAYKKEDTDRFYILLMIGSAVGNILSGIVLNRFYFFNENGKRIIDFEKVLPITLISVIIILVVYNYIEFSSIKETPREKQVNENKELGFIESLLFVFKRPYLLYIGGMLLGYNLYMGFLENIFKRMLSSCDTIPNCAMSSSQALSIQSSGIGILSLALIFVSHLIKKYTQWETKALSTPYLALFGIIIFSVPVIYNYTGNMNIYSIIVICGLVIIIPLKATKYIFFDSTKEQAYKVATEEEKTTGKMAIDSICSRLAKALSSIIISILNTLYFNNGSSSQDLLWLFLSLLASLIFLVSVYKLIPLYKSRDKDITIP